MTITAVPTESAAQTPKQDPETLALRGRPRSVVRFRKGVLVAISAGVSATVAALIWMALEPRAFQFATGEDMAKPYERAEADALAGLPKAYSDVPKLGPPLPGDLGRPILDQQRSLAGIPEVNGEQLALDPADQAAAEAKVRRATEEQAARRSALLAGLSGAHVPAAAASEAPAQSEKAAEASAADSVPRKLELADAPDPVARVDTKRGSSTPVLTAGTIIPASLITGLNSDVPGLVLAQITENVRDSLTGQTVLIPQGARLIGRYDSSVAYGQRRAQLAWERIVFPNGASLELGKMPATDSAGYAGLQGHVDSHAWQLLKGVVLSTLLGLGSELSFGRSDIARAIAQSSQQNASQAGDQLVRRSLDIAPTLTLPPGWPVRVLVDRDLVLEPWSG